MSAPSPRVRSLWPREHGAYIQLLVPLVTSLLATGPRWAAVVLALGAGFAFLASEPLRVMFGGRGPRMRARGRGASADTLRACAALAMIAGGTGLALAPSPTFCLALMLAPLIGFVMIASCRGTVQTVLGECVAAVALAGVGAPVAVAGGMNLRDALVIWSAWSLAYAATVIVVHHVISHHRRAGSRANARSGLAVLVVLLCGTSPHGSRHSPWRRSRPRWRSPWCSYSSGRHARRVCAPSESRSWRARSSPRCARSRPCAARLETVGSRIPSAPRWPLTIHADGAVAAARGHSLTDA